jgi:alpha-mannosidase
VFTWEEFGWEPHEQPAYLKSPEKYKKFAEESPVEFVTLKEYMDKYGAKPKETIYLNMDSWDKLLTWGLGGDQLRVLDRKLEAMLLAAERFDALAHSLGAQTQERTLDKAWRDLLTSQSHDVGLCEYSRWYGRMAPLDRIEDYHNFAWGVIGYQHMDAAQKQGQAVLDSSLSHITQHVNSGAGKQSSTVITVFNPAGWERTDIATTGRIFPLPPKTKGIITKTASGVAVPSQIIKSEKDSGGDLIVAEVAFQAEKVPGVGYDTYYLEFTPTAAPPATTDLRIDEANLTMENEHLRIKLDPTTGGVSSLFDKKSGHEMLDTQKGPSPVFSGRPNPDAYAQKRYVKKPQEVPANYDSSQSKAEIRWTDVGPLRATVCAHHVWPFLQFETNVTLSAGLPYVEVVSRVMADLPPMPDQLDEKERFPSDIREGYWLSLTPNFQPVSVIRDFPLAIEPTKHSAFHALTFVDLVGPDNSLLILHPGTQWFRRDSNGVLSNLLVREWESRWTGEYGWPRYAEYRHVLIPHGPNFANAERLRASAEFSQKLIALVGKPQNGSLQKRKSFINVQADNAQLLAFRKKEGTGFELRLVEVEGRESAATVELGLPVSRAAETNLLGKKVADVSLQGGKLRYTNQPWKIRTFEVA